MWWELLKPFLTLKNILIVVVILCIVGLYGGYIYYKGKVTELENANASLKTEVDGLKKDLETCKNDIKVTADNCIRQKGIDKQTDDVNSKIPSVIKKKKKKPVVAPDSKPTITSQGEIQKPPEGSQIISVMKGDEKDEEEIDWNIVTTVNNTINQQFYNGVRDLYL